MSVKLLNINCMDYMADQEDDSFDLAIVDPPYGIGADAKNSTKKRLKVSAANPIFYGSQRWDSAIPDEKYFLELKRVSKHQIIWGVNYFNYTFFSGGRIYWDKCVAMNTYSNGELAYCSKINSVKSFTFAWNGMIQGNMKKKEKRIHPTQKPVALYDWLLFTFAKPGQRILDTHLGSGSSAIAAHYFKCDFVGCERDPDYHKAAVKRFKQKTIIPTLF